MSGTQTPADEPAHDILAAEAFAMPVPDPALRAGPVTLPRDPTGIEDPHDVLAAEEFAMPALPVARASAALTPGAEKWWRPRLAAAAGALLALLLARSSRRR